VEWGKLLLRNPIMDLLQRDLRSVWHPFTQHRGAGPLLPIQGAEGPWLYSAEGSPYLDLISSWWVNLHGHGSRRLAEAIHQQCLQLDHVQFAGITHEPAVLLAEKLITLSALGESRVFFSDNGSTAVEVAIKMALQFWKNQNQARPLLLALEGGYHGDTVGAMSLGKSSGFFHPYQDLLFEVHTIPVPECWDGFHPDLLEDQILQQVADFLDQNAASVSALIVEPLVQGARGMRFHSARFLQNLCNLMRARGVLVIFDEVMTAFYRLGSLFAYQQTTVVPDILCLSKGITGGILPLGVTLARAWIFEQFLGDCFQSALAHGHSFTGNPICCAAALANLELLQCPELPARLSAIQRAMEKNLAALKTLSSTAKHRCRGTLAAFDLSRAATDYGSFAARPLAEFARNKGFLIRPIGNAVYLLPPYCISPEQIDSAFCAIQEWLKNHLQPQPPKST
jgi:adenosylmethionine-8-amino-7-oxononanoate aminotransferase